MLPLAALNILNATWPCEGSEGLSEDQGCQCGGRLPHCKKSIQSLPMTLLPQRPLSKKISCNALWKLMRSWVSWVSVLCKEPTWSFEHGSVSLFSQFDFMLSSEFCVPQPSPCLKSPKFPHHRGLPSDLHRHKTWTERWKPSKTCLVSPWCHLGVALHYVFPVEVDHFGIRLPVPSMGYTQNDACQRTVNAIFLVQPARIKGFLDAQLVRDTHKCNQCLGNA